MVFSCVSVDLIASWERCSCSYRISSVGMWVVPLALAVRMMIGGTVHPWFCISLKRGLYIKILRMILCLANWSFVYVNSMNCIFICGSGCSGGLLLYGIP